MLIRKLSFIYKFFILTSVIIIILLMLFSSLYLNRTVISRNIFFIVLLANILLAFLAININRRSKRCFLTMMVLISFVIYIIWNNYANTSPVSDYKVLLDGANEIVNGTFLQESSNKSNYFYFYNYQIGYASYLALVIKIFGNNLMIIKAIEYLYMSLTSIVIYKITEKTLTEDIAAVASIFYSTYIPNIMGSSIINNQHISTLLICLSIYFIIKSTRVSLSIAGTLLGFTQILRPVAIIIIIGVLENYIYEIMKYKNYKQCIQKLVILIISFIVVIKIFDIGLIQLKISPSDISKNNAKYFKFVLGLKGIGVYNIPTEDARKTQVYFDLKTLNFDYNKYNNQCLKVIKESISDYQNTISFVSHKMYHFMGEQDNQYIFALTYDKINDKIRLLLKIGQMQYIFLLMCTVITLMMASRKTIDSINIFCILIIGFVLVHIFIETQSRYRYEIYVFIVILASQFAGMTLCPKFKKKEKASSY